MKQGEMEREGWAKQWKMDAHPPTHPHTYSVPSASLVKGKSAGKDLRSINDGYLSCSDAPCTDRLGRRCRGRREGASSLSSLIRVVD